MREIPGYEGLYSVTDDGEVWSHPKAVAVGRRGGVRQQPMHKLKQYALSNGKAHLRVWLAKNGKKKPLFAHRLVALVYLPNPQGLPQINHLDGNPTNNRVSNLEWCDAGTNARHAVALGLAAPPCQVGEANSQSKLTADDIRAIRREYVERPNCAEIARRRGLGPTTVNYIVRRKSWAHVS